MFVKLRNSATVPQRVNLDGVAAYVPVLTSGSEAINFSLDTNNSGTLVTLNVDYSGLSGNPDEQVKTDVAYLDFLTKAFDNQPPTAADQDA